MSNREVLDALAAAESLEGDALHEFLSQVHPDEGEVVPAGPTSPWPEERAVTALRAGLHRLRYLHPGGRRVDGSLAEFRRVGNAAWVSRGIPL